MAKQQIHYNELQELPALPTGWVRIVHRCIATPQKIANIKNNGLIFNRDAAGCSPYETGGSYNNLTSMASVYNEDDFWQSLKQDDFACYNDAQYADTKIIFDIPIKEFAFLQIYGRYIKGKVDAKYLVGCIKNYNGANPKLKLPASDIDHARKISQTNSPLSATTNKLNELIAELQTKYPHIKETQIMQKLENYINDLIFINKNASTQQPEKALPRTINRHTRS